MAVTSKVLYPNTHTIWSADRVYRYFLRRPVDENVALSSLPPLAFLLLNPSTADENKDDPTVAKARRYAHFWGYGEVIILNIFAFRATNPRLLCLQENPIGDENDSIIKNTVQTVLTLGGDVVCGWGNHGQILGRCYDMRSLLKGQKIKAFPFTKQGEPGHPLYLRHDVRLECFS